MDNTRQDEYEQPHGAWLDEQAQVISFHEIPDSRFLAAEGEGFWQDILSLLERGYRVQ